MPDWQTWSQRRAFVWERTDRYGFAPHHLSDAPPAPRAEASRRAAADHARALAGRPAGAVSVQALADLVARCRADGIAVAFCWAPESPAYRARYSPAARAAAAACEARFTRAFGVPVFPAPDHLAEDDFLDGYHLLRRGAERYSRWLADEHLRPWLAAHRR